MAQGTSGNDTLSNSSAGASLDALSGNDVIDNWSERSTIRGGAGNDSIYNHTDASNSLLDAGAGNDRINNWAVRSTLIGGSGNDILYNGPSASLSVIDAGSGNDTIYSWGADGTTINTGTGNDTIENNASSSVITLGGDGNTIRTYNDAKFSIHGSAQGSELRFDIQDGSTVDATINFGGSGNDTFYATDNPELLILESGAGDNDVYNYGGEDTISIAGTLSEAYGMTYEDVRIYGNNISGSINIKNGVGKTLTIVDDNGVHRKKFSDYITSPQDVIKTFMSALDNSTLSGSALFDEAVRACSSFGSAQALINQIVSDCANASDAETFLRDYCGIIIDNQDTGAITGWDAGGSTVKTAESIVPESGSLNTFTGTSFVKNGLTLTVPSQSSMTNNQKQIINGFYTWWAQKGLDLVKESYGSNYGFDSNSSASVKTMNIEFIGEASGRIGETRQTYTKDVLTKLTMRINSYYYDSLSDVVNGLSPNERLYLDRNIAHEFTHAVMAANIDHFSDLPAYVKEGMAELTHGIDDARTDDIKTLAGNSSKLSQVFDTYDYATVSGVGNPTYAGGYILLRYLAKQAALDSGVTYNATSGNNNISAGMSKMLFNLGAGNDTLNVSGQNVTIDGGAGNDVVSLSAHQNVIRIGVGTGNDTVFNWNETDSIQSDYSFIYGTAIEGNDLRLSMLDSSVLLKGGAGKTLNWAPGQSVADGIYNWHGSTLVSGTSGDDYINQYDGARSSINAGEGNDTILVGWRSSLTSVNASAGNDLIFLQSGYETADGGGGNDTIYSNLAYNRTNRVYKFNASGGADVVIGYQSTDTINITDGSSYSTQLSGSDMIVSIGSARMTLKDASGKTLNVNGGSLVSSVNTINNSSSNKKVSGTSSAEWITNSGSNVTIQGNKGNDTIVGSSNAELILVASNHGNDLVENFGANDTLRCTAGLINSIATVGNDVVVTLKGSAYQSVVTLGGAASLNLQKSGNYIYGSTVNTIDNRTRNTIVSGSSGADSIYNYARNVTINAGSGNDTVETYGNSVKVEGGDGNDSIRSTSGTGVTLHGGNGNDTLTGSSSAEVFQYRSDGGADVITNFGTNDTLHIAAGKLNSYYSSGSDLIVHAKGTSYQGYVTLKGAASQAVKLKVGTGSVQTINSFNSIDNRTRYVFVNGTSGADSIYNYAREVTIDAGAGNDTVETYGHSTSVFGGDGNDSIRSTSGNNVTLNGGNGNDTLTGSSGSEVFQYRSDGGADVITNFGTNDTLHIAAGKLNSYYSSGSDLIVHAKGTSYSGYVTLKGAASQAVQVKVGTGAVQTINNNTFNTISNTSRYVLVTGTSANDSIYNYAREVTINAGAGNDTIETYGHSTSVLGGDGNDSIRSRSGNNVTLHGGNGNDTLTGSSGSEVYQFRSDGGNDVVTNFGINDTLKVTAGSIQNYYANGADYIVNAKGTGYSGTITLKNAVDVGSIKQSGNTIRLNASSAQLPSEEYWFEQIDQSSDEINSILSVENNEISFEIDPIDRIKTNALEIVGERPLKVRAFTSKKN